VETNKNGKVQTVKFADMPLPRYNRSKGNKSSNIFRNQWTEEGTDRWNYLGMLVNTQRAFLNESFDKRMAAFAVKKELAGRKKRKKGGDVTTNPDNGLFSDFRLTKAKMSEKQVAKLSSCNEKLKERVDTSDEEEEPTEHKGIYTYL